MAYFYRLTLEIILWNFTALFPGWRPWPSARKAAWPRAMKTQVRGGRSTNHRHRLDSFVHPCSSRNCSLQPRPTVDHHSVFLSTEPPGSLCLDWRPFTQTFCLLLTQLTRAHARTHACMDSAWEKHRLNETICQLFPTASQCDVALAARRFLRVLVTTEKKSNKQWVASVGECKQTAAWFHPQLMNRCTAASRLTLEAPIIVSSTAEERNTKIITGTCSSKLAGLCRMNPIYTGAFDELVSPTIGNNTHQKVDWKRFDSKLNQVFDSCLSFKTWVMKCQ